MGSGKRKSHKKSTGSKHSRHKSSTHPEQPQTCSTSTQTEAIKMNSLNNAPQARKFSRPRTTMVQQQKWLEYKPEPSLLDLDKRNTRNKACQTHKMGLACGRQDSNKMDTLKATMLRRRKMSIDADRSRLRKLQDDINADPPPSWHIASIMWLDVDLLERRIEEFEREEFEREEFEINMAI
ncbi:hypothetical protein KR222_002913 [Zaprionus bogoriensis]|nr:hypothetical protein KR222_002913 [Zaprionus bogoriensis]